MPKKKSGAVNLSSRTGWQNGRGELALSSTDVIRFVWGASVSIESRDNVICCYLYCVGMISLSPPRFFTSRCDEIIESLLSKFRVLFRVYFSSLHRVFWYGT